MHLTSKGKESVSKCWVIAVLTYFGLRRGTLFEGSFYIDGVLFEVPAVVSGLQIKQFVLTSDTNHNPNPDLNPNIHNLGPNPNITL